MSDKSKRPPASRSGSKSGKNILSEGSNVTPFNPPKLRSYPREVKQQKGSSTLQVRVSQSIKAGVSKLAARRGQTTSSLIWIVMHLLSSMEEIIEHHKARFPDSSPSDKQLHFRLQIQTAGKWDDVFDSSLVRPVDVIISKFLARLRRSYPGSDEASEFMHRNNSELDGLTPIEAIYRGLDRKVERVVRRLERDLKATQCR